MFNKKFDCDYINFNYKKISIDNYKNFIFNKNKIFNDNKIIIKKFNLTLEIDSFLENLKNNYCDDDEKLLLENM